MSCLEGANSIYTPLIKSLQTISENRKEGGLNQYWQYTCVPAGTPSALFDYNECCNNLQIECLGLDAACRNDYTAFVYNATYVHNVKMKELENALKYAADVENNISDWDQKRCAKVLTNLCQDHVDKACWKQPEETLDKCYNLQDDPLKCQAAP